MNLWSNWSLIALVVIGAFVVSCAAPPPTPVPTSAPSPTALVKATAVPATSTAVPATATSAPSLTLPSATATLLPTATSRPATAVPTSSPTVRSTTATAAPTVAATSVSSSGTQSNKVDMNAILPPGKGQTLLLNNCTSCHSFVCAIKGQRSVDYWQTIKNGHRDRVSSMSDDDYNTLFSYLAENFNDKKPVPELPPALQDLGCSAQ